MFCFWIFSLSRILIATFSPVSVLQANFTLQLRAPQHGEQNVSDCAQQGALARRNAKQRRPAPRYNSYYGVTPANAPPRCRTRGITRRTGR